MSELRGSTWQDYRDLYREEMNAMRARIVQQRTEIHNLHVYRARDKAERDRLAKALQEARTIIDHALAAESGRAAVVDHASDLQRLADEEQT